MKITLIILWAIYLYVCYDDYKTTRKYHGFTGMGGLNSVLVCMLNIGLTMVSSVLLFDFYSVGIFQLLGVYMLNMIPWWICRWFGTNLKTPRVIFAEMFEGVRLKTAHIFSFLF
jgi:hypothetical protein